MKDVKITTMNWKIESIPIFEDNFVFILYKGHEAIVVDPGESLVVETFLTQNDLRLKKILITHHHPDHVDGVMDLKKKNPDCELFYPRGEKLTLSSEGVNLIDLNQKIIHSNLKIQAIDLSGHTKGQIGYYFPELHILFSGDALFALGCGRVFDGTLEDLYQTIQRIKILPLETKIYCAHDYFEKNKKFHNSQKLNVEDYEVEYPLKLEKELKFNGFLKADNFNEFKRLRLERNKA